ncbi:MAG: hypothetical protein VX083_02780 [Pseudomonadota bacterium]|uniref:hypothetical protein n=1 Tax=Thalassovita sp. TaxID=1979401 RepID=UPI002AB047BA|nr:hypothetical protein [Thalassovita sp.]MEC7964408.1 hypothetical protein [Pseudomonadota bacterium]MEC8292399.1 hypothetical protein [Pseudomonadota bacterium]
MSNFRRRTIVPRFMVTMGVALMGAAYFELHLMPEPYQMSLGGLFGFLGTFWFLHASGIFKS